MGITKSEVGVRWGMGTVNTAEPSVMKAVAVSACPYARGSGSTLAFYVI